MYIYFYIYIFLVVHNLMGDYNYVQSVALYVCVLMVELYLHILPGNKN